MPPTFVGQVAGTDAYIGFATDGNQLNGYVCDGDGNSVADTFDGTAANAANGVLALATESGLALTLNVDAARLPTLIASGASVSGSLTTADGSAHSFSVGPATASSGLWQQDQTLADGTTASGGSVVLGDGSIRGSTQRGKPGSTSPTTTGMSAGAGGNNVNIVVVPSTDTVDLSSNGSGFSSGDSNSVAQGLQFPQADQSRVQILVLSQSPEQRGVVIQDTLAFQRIGAHP